MHAPSRSSFVQVAATAGMAAALGFPRPAAAQNAGMTELRLAAAPDDDITPALYARQAGLFKNAGITVTIQALSNGTAVAAAVAGGAIDIGKASLLSIINAHARGVPFVIVAPSAIADATGSYGGLLVPKDSLVKTARDLTGKTVSVPALHDIQSLGLQAWIDKNGGDSKSVSLIEIPVTGVNIALDANRIAAGILSNPSLAQAMATGKYRSIAKPVPEGFNHCMVAAWVSTVDFTAKNAAVVRRFGQVIQAASAYANAHHDKTVDLIAEFSGIDRATVATMTRAPYATTLNPVLVQPIVDAAARYGAIPASYSAAELFSPLAFGFKG